MNHQAFSPSSSAPKNLSLVSESEQRFDDLNTLANTLLQQRGEKKIVVDVDKYNLSLSSIYNNVFRDPKDAHAGDEWFYCFKPTFSCRSLQTEPRPALPKKYYPLR